MVAGIDAMVAVREADRIALLLSNGAVVFSRLLPSLFCAHLNSVCMANEPDATLSKRKMLIASPEFAAEKRAVGSEA
jgi:hypothetical protein